MNGLKNPITLEQLLQYFDDNNGIPCERIQIMHGNSWDDYIEFPTNSFMLKPYFNWMVVCMGAICENVIRVEIIEPKEN